MTRPKDTVFFSRIDTIRRRRGETIPAFARACGVSSRSIQSWVYDESEPLISYAAKVARATGYTLDALADPCEPLPDGPTRASKVVHEHVLFKGACGSTPFATRMRKAIASAGITRKELAEHVEVHRMSMHKLYLGETEPRLTTALRIARALGVELDWLAGVSR